MIPRRLLGSTISLIACLSLLLLPPTAFAKKDGPTITSTKFESAFQDIFYFDDSNVIIAHDIDLFNVWRSDDAGETWALIKEIEGHAYAVYPHPWDNQRAYVLGDSTDHWVTVDQGKSWRAWSSGRNMAKAFDSRPFSFHGRDPKRVIWNGEDCGEYYGHCTTLSYYTEDDFKRVQTLTQGVPGGCVWAVQTPSFGQDFAQKIDDRVYCIRYGPKTVFGRDYRLMGSDDYFEGGDGVEPSINNGRPVEGVLSVATVKNYMVVATRGEGTDELALFVTDDTITWHRAEFGQHRVLEEAYTILESTNYSMQVDVLGSRTINPMGHLFSSNSNGTYFTKNIDYTNRNTYGNVDFEKVANIQGVYLVNTVKNWKKVIDSTVVDKEIVTQISFDDGRTFQNLLVDGELLHLHSITDAVQGGRVFSSPAPGIVMGVGNTGKQLKDRTDGDLYVSDDTGVTWSRALKGPYMYEFGNSGAVLAAIASDGPTNKIHYSLDHGKTWKDADLPQKVTVNFLTTVPDSTTLSFMISGRHGAGSDEEHYLIKVDFAGLHERTCGKSDFEEKWPARVDEKGKPSCVMGHKQFYQRRKPSSDCVIDDDFKDPVAIFEPCECTIADFECDFNFERSEDRSECLPVATLSVPENACKDPKDTYLGTSGWRLIPGNECKGGVDMSKEVERPCTDTVKKPPTGKIAAEKTRFSATSFSQWFYLERSTTSKGHDETIIMLTSEQDIFLTRDHGKTWAPILDGEPIVAIVPNPNFHDAVYFLTGGDEVHYTIDRGDHFGSFDVPKPPSNNRLPVLKFHPDYKDWLLWAGSDRAQDRTNVYYSTDRGDNWKTLVRGARKCDYIHRADNDELIFCERFENEDPESKTLQLLSSENFFAKEELIYPNILDFATMNEFIIVAQKVQDSQSLQVDASVDGQTFAQAQFPRNFQVEHQQAYTVMDSSTHAVFLHVTVNPSPNSEYGTIIKSNSNGTNYVKIMDYVNRDTPGYVDFEKMPGLEGVAMINVVANVDGVDKGEKKKLVSKISHNDGSDWTLIPPPKKDADDRDYKCVSQDNKATDGCSLHLHSYTERRDKSATFGSPTAVGVMMAVGNVGPQLDRKDGENTDTFITNDAGITWKSVMKGAYMWEYGDQGSIIVIVAEETPTRSVFYTLDEGDSWKEFEFSPGVDMEISFITTLPSDTSRNFLLWGREVGPGNKAGIMTVNIDFSELEERSRQCDLHEEDPSKSKDYYLWEPRHPFQQENCLFGHVAQYHRKRKEAQCYNGPKLEDGPHAVTRNCTCSRQDFECDYNYQRLGDGTCELVPGYEPPDHSQVCEDKGIKVWYEPTGYRKIPLSTCQGGHEFDKIDEKPCPGYEEEYAKKHGLGGFSVFMVIIISLAAAGGVGYWVWDQYNKRGGLAGMGFGQIRLGESLANIPGGAARSSGESLFITVPVAIIAGVVAVVKTLPLLVTSIFRGAKGYMPVGGGSRGMPSGPYRSRDSFANRRQDYSDPAFVEDDELLGDDEDEV